MYFFPTRKFSGENGDKIAGMRVIPLVIEEEKMKQVKEIAGETPVLRSFRFRRKSSDRDNRK